MDQTPSNIKKLAEEQKERYTNAQKKLEKINENISKYSQKHTFKKSSLQWQQTSTIYYT